MGNLSQLNQDSMMYLLKGEWGTRKSTFALSFPIPQYWFSIDKKMDSLIIPCRNWGINPADIDFDYYTDFNNIKQKLERMRTNCKYKTLILDNITANGDVINRQSLKSKEGKKNTEGDDKGMTIGGIAVNTMGDYKAEAAGFSDEIALFQDIKEYFKINIVLIAHVIGERKLDSEVASTHHSRIIVTGGKIISAKIPTYCSEVYHFNVDRAMDTSKEGDYTCLTSHTGDDYARTSLPLPRKIVFNSDKAYDKYILPAIEKNRLAPSVPTPKPLSVTP